MSIVVRYAPLPSATVEQYDEVVRRLEESGEMPADGFDYHVMGVEVGAKRRTEVVGLVRPTHDVARCRLRPSSAYVTFS